MIGRIFRVVLALALAGLPVAPPEHVHEAEEHGHEHLLVHRHVSPHAAHHRDDGHDGVLDEDEAPLLTLDSVYTIPAAAPLPSLPPSARIALVDAPAVRVVSRSRDWIEQLIHGPPPAPTGLRAPPPSSRL